MTTCDICSLAYWGHPHCRDCHVTWKGTTKAHCTLCHQTFASNATADLHWVKGHQHPQTVKKLRQDADGLWVSISSKPRTPPPPHA